MSPQAKYQLEQIRQQFRREKADEHEAILLLREAVTLAKTHEGLRDAMDLAQAMEMRNFVTADGWPAYRMHVAYWLETFAGYPGERHHFDSPLALLYWALTEAQNQDMRAWGVTVRGESNWLFEESSWPHLLLFALTRPLPADDWLVEIRRAEHGVLPQTPELHRVSVGAVLMSAHRIQLLTAAQAVAEIEARRPPSQRRWPEDHITYRSVSELVPSFVLLTDPDVDLDTPTPS